MWRIHCISIFFILSVLISACSSSDVKSTSKVDVNAKKKIIDIDSAISDKEFVKKILIGELEQRLINDSLIDIQTVDSSILIDVRYSSLNNFMKRDVYGDLERIYLQKTVAFDLKKCNDYLKTIDSNLTLFVYDGVRPRSVQQIMWDVLEMPIHEKTKFVSNPKNGSIHNYGCAIDLTISTINGDTLDMGAGYDDIRKIAYPRHEQKFLKLGELSQQQIDNRKLLRKVMKYGGFYNIQTEWWHFNRYNRTKAKKMFKIVE